MDVLHLIGRIVFAGFFIYNGLNHLVFGRQALTGYAQFKGLSAPGAAVVGSGLLLLLGGLSILLGYKPGWGVLFLVVFLLAAAFRMHNFWKEEGDARMNDLINFTKNLALAGAALMLLAIPEPWPYSIGS